MLLLIWCDLFFPLGRVKSILYESTFYGQNVEYGQSCLFFLHIH